MANGKRQLVPRNQVSPSLVVYCSLCLHGNQYIHASFTHNNFFIQLLSANFLIEKF